MKATCLGNWVARTYADRLVKLEIPMGRRNGCDVQEYYGLSYHAPSFDPGKAVIKEGGKTVEQAEADGDSFGLDRYQAFYHDSSSFPTVRHTIPLIDGACGIYSVEKIMGAIGLTLDWVPGRRNRRNDIWLLRDVYAS